MILYYQLFIPHYQAPIVKRLNEALHGDLVVCYGQPPQHGSYMFTPDAIGSHSVVVHNRWFHGTTMAWQPFWKPLRQLKTPEIVIGEANPRILSLYPLIAWCRINGIPLILWGHGGSRRRNIVYSNNPRDILHRWLISQADAFICYTDGTKAEISQFITPEKIFVARNTLDTDTLFSLRRQLELVGKNVIKQQLGLEREYYLCVSARLTAEKRIKYLLEILALLQKDKWDVGALIIGDGPQRSALELQAHYLGLTDVHFLGAIAEWERSAPYLFISDAMVIPGYVGLSVNHALCFGLPVITQDSIPHAPEVEYIRQGETGFVVAYNDSRAMVDAVQQVFANRQAYYESTLSFVESYLTVDKLVMGVIDALTFVRGQSI
jgi:glycosyltransferase involved in cell wall biosynthesis